MKCANCEKELTPKMEIEYSRHLNEYFCSPNCATDKYFNYMESTSIDFENLPNGLVIVDGKIEAAEQSRALDLLNQPACCASFVLDGTHHQDCRLAQNASQ